MPGAGGAWARRCAAGVLPGPGGPTLTRALVYAAVRAGTEHVSVVHGHSDAADLTTALTATTDRPRRTRLAEILER